MPRLLYFEFTNRRSSVTISWTLSVTTERQMS